MGKKAEKALAKITPVNERTLKVDFNGNPGVTVVINYAPVEASEDAESHFETLSEVIGDIPKHRVILECGDFNAHLGKEDVRFSFHEKTNTNGDYLIDHVQENDLRITNAMFKKKKGKQWTFLSDMTGQKSQLDYILINKKWKNSVHNVEAYNCFSSIGSDHRLVTAKIKLSLRMSRAPERRKIYDWTMLKDPELQRQYTVEVSNRYEALAEGVSDITELYQCFIDANNKTAGELIPAKKVMRRKGLATNNKVEEARKQVSKAFDAYQASRTRTKQKDLQKKKNSLSKAYKEAEEAELNELIKMVEKADDNSKHGKSWEIINKITGRKVSKQGMIKGSTKEERVANWFTHFKNLLGSKPDENAIEEDEEEIDRVLEGLNIDDEEFKMDEWKRVKGSIKEGRTAGIDNVAPEVLKRCDVDTIMLKFANKFVVEHEKPQQWSEINMLPIPKSGDLTDPQNYRGISLISALAKTVNKMILNRLQKKIDPHLRPNQNGFRPGRNTTAHILALRRLLEGVRSHNRKAIVLYIDFRKAFDSINRNKMIKILKAYDVPPNLLQAIILMYENTKARIISPDGETEFFKILAGVLQGDTLAPYLFIIVLDYVLRKTFKGREEELGFKLHRRRSSRIKAVHVTDLDFADDLAILVEEIEQAQQALTALENEAGKVGLVCNAKKTELQSFNQTGPVIVKTKSGKIIKQVENFKYLGAWTQSSDKDIKVRKALAWSACNKLDKIWMSNISRGIKIRLFIATVESVLLYGSETWTLTKTLSNRLDGCYTRLLRKALNISWRQHQTNDQLYGGLPKASTKIRKRRMRIAGHCVRHPEEIAHKLVLWEPTEGKRSRGRRSTTYIDNLLHDADANNTIEMRKIMEDRKEWRALVEHAGRPDG